MLEQAKLFQAEIDRAQNVLIGSHLNPDGDALGSALAVSHYLDSIGKPNEVVCHHSPPSNLNFLPGVDRIRNVPRGSEFDLGIIVDLDSTERLGSTGEYFEPIPRIMVVDHHVPHEAPGDLRIIDQSAAATAVILARTFLELGVPISPQMATCLLTGIVTDTGSFRFRNTDSEALIVSGQLLECGGDISLVSEEIFQRKPLSSMRLLGIVLEHMELDLDERLAWGAVAHSDFEATGAVDADTEGFVNDLLSIQTVQVAALFRETKPEWVRVSLRSRGDVDVSEIAREFGGGGHKMAAGCSFDSSLGQAIELVIPRLRACLESS